MCVVACNTQTMEFDTSHLRCDPATAGVTVIVGNSILSQSALIVSSGL